MILDEIVRHKREELWRRKREVSLEELKGYPLFSLPRRSFRLGLEGRRRAVIAEVKRASPSRGVIRGDLDPVGVARVYEARGAAAISVVTERRYFGGSLDFLREIRQAVSLPLLCKDFLFDPYQFYEARAYGADGVLLIVALFSEGELKELLGLAASLGMEALVEVHDREELERAVRSGAKLLGINNRDLRTFRTSLQTTEELLPYIPQGTVVVSESGFSRREELERMEGLGVRAFLIGEALMASSDPGEKLSELLG